MYLSQQRNMEIGCSRRFFPSSLLANEVLPLYSSCRTVQEANMSIVGELPLDTAEVILRDERQRYFFKYVKRKTKEQTLKEISALVFLKHPHIVPLSAFVLDAASIRRVLSSACSSPSLPVVISKRMLIPSPQMAKSYVGFTTLSVHFSTYRIVVKHTRISKRQTSLCSMTVKLDLWWKNCWEYQLGS